MNEETSLAKVETPANITEEGQLRKKVECQLFNMAIETYKDVMLNGSKPTERKAAADAVVELLGKKQPKQVASAQFNFNIPPEYFKKVFGEGLPKITAPLVKDEDSTSDVLDTPFRIVSVQDAGE